LNKASPQKISSTVSFNLRTQSFVVLYCLRSPWIVVLYCLISPWPLKCWKVVFNPLYVLSKSYPALDTSALIVACFTFEATSKEWFRVTLVINWYVICTFCCHYCIHIFGCIWHYVLCLGSFIVIQTGRPFTIWVEPLWILIETGMTIHHLGWTIVDIDTDRQTIHRLGWTIGMEPITFSLWTLEGCSCGPNANQTNEDVLAIPISKQISLHGFWIVLLSASLNGSLF
jgi:hypothetical protein